MDATDTFDSKKEIQQIKVGLEPYHFSKKICDAINSQKDVDIAIKGIIKETLDNDVSVQKIIKRLQRDTLYEANFVSWKAIYQMIGGLIVTGISALLYKVFG